MMTSKDDDDGSDDGGDGNCDVLAKRNNHFLSFIPRLVLRWQVLPGDPFPSPSSRVVSGIVCHAW